MTRDQAKKAYRLAYVTVTNLLHFNSERATSEPYKTKALEEFGLTEEERDEIWHAARDDFGRRHGAWTDDQIRKADELAEHYASIYVPQTETERW